MVGDFNNWEHRKDCAGEGYMGKDDNGYWRVVIEDKLREGEEEDLLGQVCLMDSYLHSFMVQIYPPSGRG